MYQQRPSNHFSGGDIEAATTPTRLVQAFFKSLLATALFRCWHILLFYFAWATVITLINVHVTSLTFAPTLLTVVGTVLGFVVSYRTTSSFERYNEGRRYWSQIMLGARTLARAVWFHVPELPPPTPQDEQEGRSEEERRARCLIEKKTVINLIEAFAVAVKHYLRGEEGIAYVDLYHLVKFLPSYSFPTGVIPTEYEAAANLMRTQSYRDAQQEQQEQQHEKHGIERGTSDATFADTDGGLNGDGGFDAPVNVSIEPGTPGGTYNPAAPSDGAPQPHISLGVPLPAPATTTNRKTSRRARSSFLSSRQSKHQKPKSSPFPSALNRTPTFIASSDDRNVTLLPASLPPKNSVFDIFPFSLFVKMLTTKGKQVEGKKAAKLRAKTVVTTRNVPLEISMYLTSYVATIAQRKVVDVPTNNLLIGSVNQLTDALTGLERILTTPIPFSYSIHLWLVVIIYNLALPFQIYSTMKWLTIPATGIVSFFFFGFLVAGEEIENPFGYDKNDLNMDHFTHNIIRNELRALTAFPPPAPELWAFSPRNDRLFTVFDPHFASEKSGLAGMSGSAERVVGMPPRGDSNLNVGGEAGMPTRMDSGMSVRGRSGVGLTPEEWIRRGTAAMRDALARAR
ncbi:UPF0187-domain-containing protein [Fomitiporia mediterranea MF3/22]|uniref:UPF0187-domain-containing protein n=1 Tax=Fomitiporia mediterranea (strain MF3/22) TaxID=694068 RepID=UPI00044084C6|nr:UPF0187-domain-containing protein [Fomitiporia mediterranea MF3/22]EJD07947.1 UPF0187-domain-containing protein [Fomitiporia mediterranea MF3/22]